MSTPPGAIANFSAGVETSFAPAPVWPPSPTFCAAAPAGSKASAAATSASRNEIPNLPICRSPSTTTTATKRPREAGRRSGWRRGRVGRAGDDHLESVVGLVVLILGLDAVIGASRPLDSHQPALGVIAVLDGLAGQR